MTDTGYLIWIVATGAAVFALLALGIVAASGYWDRDAREERARTRRDAGGERARERGPQTRSTYVRDGRRGRRHLMRQA